MANGFNLTLDTLAPTGSISRGDKEYVNNEFNLTITNTNSTGKKMKIWFDEFASTQTVPEGLSWIDISSKGSSFTQSTEFGQEEGVFYYHLVLLDEVNNQSVIYHTARIVRDLSAPTVSNVWVKDPDSGSTTITNNRTGNYFGFTFGSAGLAPVIKAVISCSDFTSSVEISNPVSPYDSSSTSPKKTVSFKDTATEGPKTVTVTITDACGNTNSATGTITLDTIVGDLTVTLYKSSGTESLPEKINYSGIKVGLVSANSDIVGYKLWEGSTEPDAWTTMSSGKLNVKLDRALSAGDGTKTINARIKDQAGSIGDIVSKSVMVDYSAPVITMVSDKEWIAGSVSGDVGTETKAILTLTHDESISGLSSWDLKNGNVSIKGSLTSIPSTFELTETSGSLSEGNNKIKFEVKDQAGNSSTKEVVVKLDKAKPTGKIDPLSTWYNNWGTFACSLSEVSDTGSGVKCAYVWTSTSQSDTTVPSGTPALAPSELSNIPSSKITGSVQQSASNYIHAQIVDNVGHVYYPASVKFGFDNEAPSSITAHFLKASYNSTSAKISVTAAVDALSGISKMKITGDITAAGGKPAGQWFDFSTATLPQEVSVTLAENAASSTVETKTVEIYLKDLAGNESGALIEIETELDQSVPGATLALRNADDSGAQPARTGVAKFSARVSGFDDGSSGKKASEYKLYGDFTYDAQSDAGISETDASWKTLTYESGLNYMLISNMYCTSNLLDEATTKNIYLKVKDDAGNVSTQVSQSFVYDISAPEVEISTNPDYYILSKVHSLRRNTSGEIAGKYADQINFGFTPSESIQAYKVCAYLDIDNAKWKDSEKTQPRLPAEEVAIPTAGGSSNMSGTGLDTGAEIKCSIRGADFENALVARGAIAGSTAEGAHIVVIYAQDLAGTWSELANFEV